MPTTRTCGTGKQFIYQGSIDDGVVLQYRSCKVKVCSEFLKAIIDQFKGKVVKGGFSMTNPPIDGVGHWVLDNSKTLNVTPLSPRHGSHIAAILRDTGYLEANLDGNAVILKFVDGR
jgi:hypothetical protein